MNTIIMTYGPIGEGEDEDFFTVKTVNAHELKETNVYGANFYQRPETGIWYVRCACTKIGPDLALCSDAYQWWANHWRTRPFCEIIG